MKKILVTGGAGYVGSVLSEKLLASGYQVVVFDSLIYGDRGIAGLRSHPSLRLINADVRDVPAFRKSLAKVDGVIHLAAIANDPSGELDPNLTREVNVNSYHGLLSESVAAGVQRFINMSSTAVYGINHSRNLSEDDSLNPLTAYASCKAKAEVLVRAFNTNDFTTVSLRGGTVCGWSPRMRFDLCANTLVGYAVVDRKLAVWGGSQQRPQIHIDDLTDFLVALLTIEAPRLGGRVFNAAGQNISVAEIAETVKEVMNGELDLINAPPREDERTYHVSSERIARELGLRPQRSVSDAIVEIIAAHHNGLWQDPREAIYHNVCRMAQANEAAAQC